MKFYVFPDPLDSTCTLTTDGGVVINGQPDTYSNGAPCQSYTIPANVPNSNGATQEIAHDGRVTSRLHGILLWGKLLPGAPADQAGFLVDVFPLPVNPTNPWPVAPTRDEACSVSVPFQGLTATVSQFGTFPVFGPETTSLTDEDLVSYLDQLKAAGATHAIFAVSWNYRGPWYQYPVPGTDLSQNVPELKRRIEIAIRKGFKILLFCAGDGEGSGPGYNDPVGWTYGRQWLMNNFQRIYDGLGPTPESANDCRPFIVFLPGFDGTDSYAWITPENVVAWWDYARSVIARGGGYLGQEWSAGHCQLGGRWDGPATYIDGPARALDVILQEFPASPPMPTAESDAVWQIVGRMVRPYHRPPDQHGDPNPPYYLAQGTPRGPYFYIAFEYDTYNWVRGQVSAATVVSDRQYLRNLGCAYVC